VKGNNVIVKDGLTIIKFKKKKILFIFIVYVYLLGGMGAGWELDGLVLTFRS
jgi:hypothetical protein